MKKNFFNACLKTNVKYQTIISAARNHLKNEKGATAVEYALVIAVVVIVVVGAAATMEGPLNTFFQDVVSQVSNWMKKGAQ